MGLGMREIERLAGEAMVQKLPNETYPSLPIPVRGRGAPAVWFLYAPAHPQRTGGHALLAPNHVVRVDAAAGSTPGVEPITQAEMGQKRAEGDFIGVTLLPAGMTPAEYVAERGRLYQTYDALLPPFTAGAPKVPLAQTPDAARFVESFGKLAEGPLLPYYRSVGREFLEWVEAAARRP